ncbi:MAG: SDR family NAD(P)-dependent oxidoreductase [Minisyncoccia bacterium]|jgi:2-deoxy-D-gluconate 3-dehydrogenase
MNETPLQALLNLSGKTAIVTGGAVGIGLGISRRLAEAGANVLIADINAENAEKAKQELLAGGWKAEAVHADVSNEANVQAMVQKAVSVFGGVDILVNNAGIYPSVLLMNMTAADFERVLAVNLESVFLCTKSAAEQMIKQGRGGRIINITSIDALHPSSAGLAHYDASKHGVWGFTKNVALELAPHNIWVNAVAPGGIATPGVAGMQKKAQVPAGVDMEAMLKNFLARIPMKRMGEPDDIGKAVLFLASEMSSYMTGSQIVVDGGVLLA